MTPLVLGEKPFIHEHSTYENSRFGKYVEIGTYNILTNTTVCDYSYTGQWCIIQNTEIMKFSNIAAMVRIGPTAHPMDRPSLHHFTYRRKKYGLCDSDDQDFFNWRAKQQTIIGHDTWIGHGAVIMPKVSIGSGSVIGAGAVVTKNIPPYSVAVGTPAQVIKRRFTEKQISQLLCLKWWEWSHEKIRENLNDFYLPIDKFLEKHGGI